MFRSWLISLKELSEMCTRDTWCVDEYDGFGQVSVEVLENFFRMGVKFVERIARRRRGRSVIKRVCVLAPMDKG